MTIKETMPTDTITEQYLPIAYTVAKYTKVNSIAEDCLNAIIQLESNKSVLEHVLSADQITAITKAAASLQRLKLMTQPSDAVKFHLSQQPAVEPEPAPAPLDPLDLRQSVSEVINKRFPENQYTFQGAISAIAQWSANDVKRFLLSELNIGRISTREAGVDLIRLCLRYTREEISFQRLLDNIESYQKFGHKVYTNSIRP